MANSPTWVSITWVTDNKFAYSNITSQAVRHQIADCRIAESVEEVGTERYECHIYPRLVAEEVAELLETKLFGTDGFMTLACHQSAYHSHQRGYYTKSCTKYCILMLLCAAYEFLQEGEAE